MITCKTPLRVSLFGGSTDHPGFLKEMDWGLTISFPISLHTYCTIFKDVYGSNSQKQNFILNYSVREETNKIQNIKNELLKHTIEYLKLPPLNITLTSDIYSKGSGLASSSSYIISIIKAAANQKVRKIELSKVALKIERNFNECTGLQDPYGCCFSGFKIMEFDKHENVKFTILDNDIFNDFSFWLLPTKISRQSNKILQSLKFNHNKINQIRTVAVEAQKLILKKKYTEFVDLIKLGWSEKKKSSQYICSNKKLTEIDDQLEKSKDVLAHKLCGAGGGGFFLLITKKGSKPCFQETILLNPVL